MSVIRDTPHYSLNAAKLKVLPKIDVAIAQPRPRGAVAYDVDTDTIWYSNGLEWLPLSTDDENIYGYAEGSNATTFAANALITFNTGTIESNGITGPAANGSSFTIAVGGAGVYEFDFYLSGHDTDVVTDRTPQVVLNVNGVDLSSTYLYSAGTPNVVDTNKVLVGHGFVELDDGDVIALKNRTGNGTKILGNTSDTTANRTFMLKRIG